MNKVIFKLREGDKANNHNECPIGGKWVEKTTDDFFKNKRVVLFSLPGAFTPTCSSLQLPGFENSCDRFKKLGIDEIYCCSVNDAYTMNAWYEKMGIKNVVWSVRLGNYGTVRAAMKTLTPWGRTVQHGRRGAGAWLMA